MGTAAGWAETGWDGALRGGGTGFAPVPFDFDFGVSIFYSGQSAELVLLMKPTLEVEWPGFVDAKVTWVTRFSD